VILLEQPHRFQQLLEILAKTEFGKPLLSKAIQFEADGSHGSVDKRALGA
jgi:hypothetical protein